MELQNIQQFLVDISDDYEHLDPSIEYILENVLYDGGETNKTKEYTQLADLYNSLLVDFCECSGRISCSGIQCSHGASYAKIHDSNELVLNRIAPEKQGHDIIYECASMCRCKVSTCENRLVQYGPRKHLQIIDSMQYNSKGLATTVPIPSGGFICEYAGELLTSLEAQRRIVENQQKLKMNYILCMNEKLKPYKNTDQELPATVVTIVDPSRKGNIGRYLNHSCDPNCEIFSVRVDCPIPKVGIFAKRSILAGEELCFHYGGEVKWDPTISEHKNISKKYQPTTCLCGSNNCAKVLPDAEF